MPCIDRGIGQFHLDYRPFHGKRGKPLLRLLRLPPDRRQGRPVFRALPPVGSQLDARVLGPQLLPGGLGEATGIQIERAESPATALALLLASPEFLRR